MATTVCIPLAVHLPFGEDITIRQDTGISIPLRIALDRQLYQYFNCSPNHVISITFRIVQSYGCNHLPHHLVANVGL